MMRVLVSIIFAVCSLLLTTNARSEVMVGDSLEWLTCQSDLVVTGRIEKIVSIGPVKEGSRPIVNHEITLAIIEIVKGKTEKRIVIHFPSTSAKLDGVLASGMRSLEPTLFFLTKAKDGNLRPTRAELVFPVFDLAHPVQSAFNSKGKNVFAKEAILKTCRDADRIMVDYIKKHPGGRVAEKRVNVGYDTPAGKAFYAGSATFLRVPDLTTEERK